MKVFLIGILLFSFALFTPFSFLFASGDGSIDTIYKFAWSANVGWMNWNASGGNVRVTDTQLVGAVWVPNYGWINLQPPKSGVMNDGAGNLSGYAWGEQLGYIDFSGVTIDSDGFFHGYASGTITGQISLNCLNTNSCGDSNFKVRTNWRPTVAPPVIASLYIPPTPPILPSSLVATTFVTSAPAAIPESQKFTPISSSCPYFTIPLKLGMKNAEVGKMQTFLQFYNYLSKTKKVDNVFDQTTFVAVKAFQKKYAKVILTPWGQTAPTGYWYITTIKQANILVNCKTSGTLEITASGAIRATPSAKAKVLLTAKKNQKYLFNGMNNDWYFVEISSTKTGWIDKKYIKVTKKQ